MSKCACVCEQVCINLGLPGLLFLTNKVNVYNVIRIVLAQACSSGLDFSFCLLPLVPSALLLPAQIPALSVPVPLKGSPFV